MSFLGYSYKQSECFAALTEIKVNFKAPLEECCSEVPGVKIRIHGQTPLKRMES